MIRVFAPAGGPIDRWVREAPRQASAGERLVVVCAPGEVEARRAEYPDAAVVACLPLSPGDDLIAAGAFDQVAIRADAYATTQAGLYEALELAALEDRAARARGALRLTWLGSLGTPAPLHAGPVGRAYPLDEPLLIGRDAGCAVVLRTGAHSDQNTVARRHARVELEPAGVRVRDLRSTNGTWVNGSRVTDELIAPGAELAFACTFRFRLDGAAGRAAGA